MKEKRAGTGLTLKEMKRQQHREASQRLVEAERRGDTRAFIIESVNLRATKP